MLSRSGGGQDDPVPPSVCLLDSCVSVLSFMLELGRSLVVMWEGGVAGGWGLGVLGGLWWCGGVSCYLPEQG